MAHDLFNIEAEQTVIGSILIEPDSFYQISLTPEDFYYSQHIFIFEAISKMAIRGEYIDLITLTEQLMSRETLSKSGGAAYISSLTVIPSAGSIIYYAEIIKKLSALRKLEQHAKHILTSIQERKEPEEIIAGFMTKILNVRESKKSRHISDVVNQTLKSIETTKSVGIRGITSGLIDLDRRTGGFIPGEFTIIAGRPSMGKSALGFQMALDISKKGLPVSILSLEMPDESIVGRYISAMSGIENRLLMQGAFPKNDWEKVMTHAGEISDCPVYIHDEGGMTLTSVISTIQSHKLKYDISIAFIDYIQLIKLSGRSKNEEVGEISQAIKALAKKLNIAIVALAQLSRGLEYRNDKRPILSDLRDSGSLEQDADVVMFVYRHYIYSRAMEDKNKAELILAKGRNIGTGTINMFFDDKTTNFKCLREY
jgi:replicative DNA helicase